MNESSDNVREVQFMNGLKVTNKDDPFLCQGIFKWSEI